MALFKALSTRFRMSQAAAIIEGLLELQARQGLLFEENAARLAGLLVHKIQTTMPEFFDGTHGPMPHKLTIAAVAMADGMSSFQASRELKNSLLIALAEVFKDVERNGRTYGFSAFDNQLLEASLKNFIRESELMNQSSPLSSLSLRDQ